MVLPTSNQNSIHHMILLPAEGQPLAAKIADIVRHPGEHCEISEAMMGIAMSGFVLRSIANL